MNVAGAIKDKDFRALGEPEQVKIIESLDKDFAGLPAEEKPKALRSLMNAMPAERSMGDEVKHQAKFYSERLMTGVANVLGAPMDIVNAIATGNPIVGAVKSAMGRDNSMLEKPVLGAESIKGAVLPAEQEKADGIGERVLGRIVEEVGSVIPGLGVTGLLRAAPTTMKAVEALRQMSMTKIAGIEAALATSGGAGAAAMKEILPDSPLAEWAGQLVGSFGPTAAVDIFRASKKVALSQIPAVTQKQAERAIGGELQNTLTSPAATRNMEEAKAVAAKIPGFKPTLGQATGDPKLVMAERAMAASSEDAGAAAVNQVADANSALRKAFKQAGDTAIGGTEGPQAVQDSLRAMTAKQHGQLENQLETVKGRAGQVVEGTRASLDQQAEAISKKIADSQAQVQKTIDSIKPALDKQSAGKAIRGPIQEQNRALSLKADELSKEIDPANVVTLDTGGITKAMQDAETTQGKFTGLPKEVSSLFEEWRKTLAPKETFNQLRDFVTRVEQEITKDMGSDSTKAITAILKPIKTAAQKSLDELSDPSSQTSLFQPDAARRYREFKTWYASEATRLRQGVAADVLQRGSKGEMDVADSAVAEAFFRSGKGAKESAQQFKAAVGSDAAANTALRDVVRQNFLSSAVDTNGVVSVKRSAEWMKKHSEALSEFPEIRKEFANVVVSQRSVDRLLEDQQGFQRSAKETIKAVRGQAKDEVRAAEKAFRDQSDVDADAVRLFLENDPDKAAGKLLASKNPGEAAKALLTKLQGDEAATRGLKKAVWDEIDKQSSNKKPLESTGELLFNPDQMREAIKKHRKVLEQLYAPETLKDLETIQKGSEIVRRTQSSPLRGGSDTAEKMMGQLSEKDWFQRLYGNQTLPGPAFVARFAKVVIDKFSDNQLRAVMERAFYDPEVAQTLARAARGGQPEMIAKRIHAHLANIPVIHQEEKK